jgi:hypothetical protein
VEPFQAVRGPQPGAMRGGERIAGQAVVHLRLQLRRHVRVTGLPLAGTGAGRGMGLGGTRRREDLPQVGSQPSAMLGPDQPQEVAREVDLAPLPTGALEVAGDRRPQARVVIAGDEGDAAQPARLEVPEQLVVGGFALRVGHRHRQDLTPSVIAHAGDDQHTLADHLAIDADVLVAGIHAQIGVGRQRPLPPGGQLRIEAAGDRRDHRAVR